MVEVAGPPVRLITVYLHRHFAILMKEAAAAADEDVGLINQDARQDLPFHAPRVQMRNKISSLILEPISTECRVTTLQRIYVHH